MKQKKLEILLTRLDSFINNLDNDDNDMDKLIEEINLLEKQILKYQKNIDNVYVDTISTLKNTLINIKENKEAISLLKTVVNQNKNLSQKMLVKLQEKGISIQSIISEIKSDISKLETTCKNYNQYREKVKNQQVVLNNNQTPKQIITKLNVRLAAFTLASLTTVSATSYATFKLLNKDDNKIKLVSYDELISPEVKEQVIYLASFNNNEPIVSRTVTVKTEPIISTPTDNSEIKIIISNDFSKYPELNCNNKHVYYRFAKSYTFTDEELSILMKVVTKESGAKNVNYNEAYIESMAVTSTILNRFEDKSYYKYKDDLIALLSAPSQFTTYQGALKMSDDEIPDVVKDAVMDTLNGVRNHEFVQFRANSNKAPGRILITPHGNNHFDVMNPIEEVKEVEYIKK